MIDQAAIDVEIGKMKVTVIGDMNADRTVNLVDSTILHRVLAGEPVP